MTTNRYIQQKFAGPAWRRSLKRLWLELTARPAGVNLGVETYVRRPFRCTRPDRLSIGARCTVGAGLKVQLLTEWFEQRFEPTVSIGDDTYIGTSCEIVAVEGVHIGRGCTISDDVYFNDSSHDFSRFDGLIMDRPLTSKGAIRVGDGTFIGRRATILPGVTIGACCVVGASSVVSRTTPDYSMVAGNPARVVARFDTARNCWTRVC